MVGGGEVVALLVPPEPTFFGDEQALVLGQPRGQELEDLPDEAGQLTRDRHGDFVALFAAGQQLPGALVQPGLGFPGAGFESSVPCSPSG